MTDDELLLALSTMMDRKLKPIEDRTKNIEMLIEHNILPRLQTIESCYTSTYRRYVTSVNQIDMIRSDVDITKKVVAEHSEKLQSIS